MKKLAIAAMLVPALAAAGCGGGGGTTLSKERYGARLNKICADLNAKNKQIGEPNSLPQVVTKGPQLVQAFDDAIAKAKKLKPPAELKDDARRFVSLGEQIRNHIDELLDAAKKQDEAALVRIGRAIEPLQNESDALARNKLGAPACAAG